MDNRYEMVITDKGEVAAIVDITAMPLEELQGIIEVQEVLGREWHYRVAGDSTL